MCCMQHLLLALGRMQLCSECTFHAPLCNALLQALCPNPDIRQLIAVPRHAVQQGVALLEQPPKLSIEEPTYSQQVLQLTL